MFDQAWLDAVVARWNTHWSDHHHRFDRVGTVAMTVTDRDANLGCTLRFDGTGRLAHAATRPRAAPDDVPAFTASLETWREYVDGGRSAAYYFALGRMTYRGDPTFLLAKGLLFDIFARCAKEVSAPRATTEDWPR